MSVLFVDMVAFSSMTRGLDPEEVRDLADSVLTAVAGVVEDLDGYVDSFKGDGLIALFGAPHSHPDDPQRAVLAAAKALDTIQEVGRSRGHELVGRAGVNTGIVIAGAVGSGKVRSYTVMGSAVNLAARLEEVAGPGEVWVGPETTALEKNAALDFQRYLLSDEQQQAGLAYGLRPANPRVPLDAIGDSLFVKWQNRGVEAVIPRADAMRNPDREVLLALLRWFELNVAE